MYLAIIDVTYSRKLCVLDSKLGDDQPTELQEGWSRNNLIPISYSYVYLCLLAIMISSIHIM